MDLEVVRIDQSRAEVGLVVKGRAGLGWKCEVMGEIVEGKLQLLKY